MNEHKKTPLCMAVTMALGISSIIAENAYAELRAVTGIVIGDVGTSSLNGGCGFGGTAADGKTGGFSFSDINPCTFAGVTTWDESGSTNDGIIDGSRANGINEFTPGFLFADLPIKPFTSGPFDITIDDVTNELTVNELPWEVEFAGTTIFPQQPDPGTVEVNWVEPFDADRYRVNFQWSHVVTSAEDPSGSFVGFNARWLVEGTATTGDIIGIPRITVTIDVPDGDTQECARIGGSFVQLIADVGLFGGAELASVTWSIDSQPAGTGISIEPFLAPGGHAIEVTAISTTGLESSDTTSVSIVDTTAPELEVGFVDRRTGEPINSIDRLNVEWVIVKIDATDVCDSQLTTEGIGGFPVNDGDQLKIRGIDEAVTLTINRLTVSATTTDDAGNTTTDTADLPITE